MNPAGYPYSSFPGERNTRMTSRGYSSPYPNMSGNYNPSALEFEPHLDNFEFLSPNPEHLPPMAYGGYHEQAAGMRLRQQQEQQPMQRRPSLMVNCSNFSSGFCQPPQRYPYMALVTYTESMGPDAQMQPTIQYAPQTIPTPPSTVPSPFGVDSLTSEPESTLKTPEPGPCANTELSKKRKRSYTWLMDADKAKKQKARRDSAMWFRNEAERLMILNEGQLDDEGNAKVDEYVKKANDILDELRAEDAMIEETEGSETARALKKSRLEYEERFKAQASHKDEEWRHIRRERNLKSRGKGAQAEAEKEKREKREKLKEARAKRSRSTSESIQATPKPVPVTQQLPPASQQATAEEDLGFFGMGNDIFKIPAAMFAPTSSRVACLRVVLPHPSIKQVELGKETESTPTPPPDYQGGVDLVEDDGLDDLFEDDGLDDLFNDMDDHET